MTATERFRLNASNLFSRFGSEGILSVPSAAGVYNPDTGDTTFEYSKFPIKYAAYPLNTNPESDFGLAAFQQSTVTFYVDDISVVVNETCIITDLNGVNWGIQSLNKVFSDDLIVGYEAQVKATV